MRRLLPLLCLLAATSTNADTLGDVRSAVKRLTAKQPVRATLTIQQRVASNGKFSNDKSTRLASAEVAHDAAGVSIVIPQGLLDQVTYERQPNPRNDVQDAINTFQPDIVIQALNYRDAFLAMLDGAVVKEDKRVPFRGKTARLVVLMLKEKDEKKADSIQVGSVDRNDILSLWVDDQGLPLAAERRLKATAGFMFLKGTFSSQVSYQFAVANDRLLLARVESSDAGSGLGQNVNKHSVQTLVVH